LHRSRGEKGGRRGAGPAWARHTKKKRRREGGSVGQQDAGTAAAVRRRDRGGRALGGSGWKETERGLAIRAQLDEQ
jgi:hypothetical protein